MLPDSAGRLITSHYIHTVDTAFIMAADSIAVTFRACLTASRSLTPPMRSIEIPESQRLRISLESRHQKEGMLSGPQRDRAFLRRIPVVHGSSGILESCRPSRPQLMTETGWFADGQVLASGRLNRTLPAPILSLSGFAPDLSATQAVDFAAPGKWCKNLEFCAGADLTPTWKQIVAMDIISMYSCAYEYEQTNSWFLGVASRLALACGG